MGSQVLRRCVSFVYAPHVLRWQVFVPNSSPEQVHGALSHTINDHSWYWSSPKLVYQPKMQVLDQRPNDPGEPRRKIFGSRDVSVGGAARLNERTPLSV